MNVYFGTGCDRKEQVILQSQVAQILAIGSIRQGAVCSFLGSEGVVSI